MGEDKVAICPGSFDPVTLGHIDVIKRSLKIFDKLIVIVLENPRKEETLFTSNERADMIRECVKDMKVEVDIFNGLLVDYLKKNNINFVVRGLRALSDFDYEFQMAMVNKSLDPDMETVFIMTGKKYFYLNSATVRELAKYGSTVSDMVPDSVGRRLKEKFK